MPENISEENNSTRVRYPSRMEGSTDDRADQVADIQRYRRWKRRRRQAQFGRSGQPQPSKETEVFISFATWWAPYGGASDEDIFVRFGMTRSRFIERLWQIVTATTIDQTIVQQFSEVYPLDQGRYYAMVPVGKVISRAHPDLSF